MTLLERFFKNSLQGAFLQEIFNFFYLQILMSTNCHQKYFCTFVYTFTSTKKTFVGALFGYVDTYRGHIFIDLVSCHAFCWSVLTFYQQNKEIFIQA